MQRKSDTLPEYERELFIGWRRPTAASATIRLLGGLPDPALFPRRDWLRHYRAALAELPYPAAGYPDILGAESLRQALTDYLGRVRGAVAAPDRIMVCAGFTQGLTLLGRALRRAGARRIAVEEPCHGWHRGAIEAIGLQPVPIPVDERGLDLVALANSRADAALVAPAHSYPSGGTLDGARRQALATWAERSGMLIIEDDYDAELRYDRRPLGALQGLAPDQVVYIGSVSKTLTPALRLGWLVAPPRLIEPLAREKHNDDMGSSLFEQLALARLIGSGAFARHLRHIRPVYRARRDATIATLAALLPSVCWHGEAAGLHLYLTLPDYVDEQAVARAAYERGVLLELGAWHWAAPDRAPPSLVLGYGSTTETTIRRGIRVIADAIEEPSRNPAPFRPLSTQSGGSKLAPPRHVRAKLGDECEGRPPSRRKKRNPYDPRLPTFAGRGAYAADAAPHTAVCSTDWYVAITTPLVAVWASTSRSVVAGLPSAKRRRPDPSTSGWIISMYSSTSPRRISEWISSPLPMMWRSSPSCCLRSATASAASPSRRVGVGHGSGSRSVRDATYFLAAFSGLVHGLSGCVFQ